MRWTEGRASVVTEAHSGRRAFVATATVVVVSAILVGAYAARTGPLAVRAAYATTCSGKTNVEAANSTNGHRGVKAGDPDGLSVYTGGATCKRVSSLALGDTATDEQVEVGWVDANALHGPDECYAENDGHPHFFGRTSIPPGTNRVNSIHPT
jgi:hypothetical protein